MPTRSSGTAGHLVSIPAQGDDDEAGRAARDAAEAGATALVVICDDLFETVTGAPCGGPAEDGEMPPGGRFGSAVDRWEASPGRWISVYLAEFGPVTGPEIANAGAPAPAFAVPEDPVVEGDRAVPWCVL